MTSIRPIIAISCTLFVLAAASLLDVARMQPMDAAGTQGSMAGTKHVVLALVHTNDAIPAGVPVGN